MAAYTFEDIWNEIYPLDLRLSDGADPREPRFTSCDLGELEDHFDELLEIVEEIEEDIHAAYAARSPSGATARAEEVARVDKIFYDWLLLAAEKLMAENERLGEKSFVLAQGALQLAAIVLGRGGDVSRAMSVWNEFDRQASLVWEDFQSQIAPEDKKQEKRRTLKVAAQQFARLLQPGGFGAANGIIDAFVEAVMEATDTGSRGEVRLADRAAKDDEEDMSPAAIKERQKDFAFMLVRVPLREACELPPEHIAAPVIYARVAENFLKLGMFGVDGVEDMIQHHARLCFEPADYPGASAAIRAGYSRIQGDADEAVSLALQDEGQADHEGALKVLKRAMIIDSVVLVRLEQAPDQEDPQSLQNIAIVTLCRHWQSLRTLAGDERAAEILRGLKDHHEAAIKADDWSEDEVDDLPEDEPDTHGGFALLNLHQNALAGLDRLSSLIDDLVAGKVPLLPTNGTVDPVVASTEVCAPQARGGASLPPYVFKGGSLATWIPDSHVLH